MLSGPATGMSTLPQHSVTQPLDANHHSRPKLNRKVYLHAINGLRPPLTASYLFSAVPLQSYRIASELMIEIPAQVANAISAQKQSRKRRHMTWQAVQEEVLSRIQSNEWPAGELIPTETTLATEFGCARATVNRALQYLANSGVLERRRKVGTRVTEHPNVQAVRYLLRREIENSGHRYGYRLLEHHEGPAPAEVAQAMLLRPDEPLLRIRALFRADDRPYCCEERWINTYATPGLNPKEFEQISPCEWLLGHIPVNRASLSMGAAIAGDGFIARSLAVTPDEPVLVAERLDWVDNMPVSLSRRYFPHGHRFSAEL